MEVCVTVLCVRVLALVPAGSRSWRGLTVWLCRGQSEEGKNGEASGLHIEIVVLRLRFAGYIRTIEGNDRPAA